MTSVSKYIRKMLFQEVDSLRNLKNGLYMNVEALSNSTDSGMQRNIMTTSLYMSTSQTHKLELSWRSFCAPSQDNWST